MKKVGFEGGQGHGSGSKQNLHLLDIAAIHIGRIAAAGRASVFRLQSGRSRLLVYVTLTKRTYGVGSLTLYSIGRR
jgi:hypothetical protein